MKKITVIVLFCCLNLFGQKSYFINVNGDKTILYENIKKESHMTNTHIVSGDYALTGYYLWYHDKEGELKKIAQSKIKELITEENRYVRMKIGSMFGFKRLHEIVMESDTYLLSQYYEGGFYYAYITNKATGKFEEKKMKISWNNRRDKKIFKKKILPYFKECSVFITIVKSNIEEKYKIRSRVVKNRMFKDISNMKCQ